MARSVCTLSGYHKVIAAIANSWEPTMKIMYSQTTITCRFAQGQMLYMSSVAFLATKYAVEYTSSDGGNDDDDDDDERLLCDR